MKDCTLIKILSRDGIPLLVYYVDVDPMLQKGDIITAGEVPFIITRIEFGVFFTNNTKTYFVTPETQDLTEDLIDEIVKKNPIWKYV